MKVETNLHSPSSLSIDRRDMEINHPPQIKDSDLFKAAESGDSSLFESLSPTQLSLTNEDSTLERVDHNMKKKIPMLKVAVGLRNDTKNGTITRNHHHIRHRQPNPPSKALVDTITYVLAIVGTITCCLTLLAHGPTFCKIIQDHNTNTIFSILPHLLSWGDFGFWSIFGMITPLSHVMLLMNIIGFLTMTTYLAVYVKYASAQDKLAITWKGGLFLILFGSILAILLGSNIRDSAPSTSRICICTVVDATIWAAFGILKSNDFTMAPNVVTAVIAASEFFITWNTPKDKGSNNEEFFSAEQSLQEFFSAEQSLQIEDDEEEHDDEEESQAEEPEVDEEEEKSQAEEPEVDEEEEKSQAEEPEADEEPEAEPEKPEAEPEEPEVDEEEENSQAEEPEVDSDQLSFTYQLCFPALKFELESIQLVSSKWFNKAMPNWDMKMLLDQVSNTELKKLNANFWRMLEAITLLAPENVSLDGNGSLVVTKDCNGSRISRLRDLLIFFATYSQFNNFFKEDLHYLVTPQKIFLAHFLPLLFTEVDSAKMESQSSVFKTRCNLYCFRGSAGYVLDDDSMEKLRVLAYELPSKYNKKILLKDPRCLIHMFAAEIFMHKFLLLSQVCTLNPEEADWFYTPVCATCDSTPNGLPLPFKSPRMMISAMQLISSNCPYWNQTEGADHFFVVPLDFGACFHYQDEKAIGRAILSLVQRTTLVQTLGQRNQVCLKEGSITVSAYAPPQKMQAHLVCKGKGEEQMEIQNLDSNAAKIKIRDQSARKLTVEGLIKMYFAKCQAVTNEVYDGMEVGVG
ncbi:hypothetical protein ACFE04_026967 [Oxalis oulophora]